ncbi:MAG: hypothetical protein MRZ24_04190, partial [Clostridiales bacterium]|nr:hypothetical protein [Clostridiales bacterium]
CCGINAASALISLLLLSKSRLSTVVIWFALFRACGRETLRGFFDTLKRRPWVALFLTSKFPAAKGFNR